MSRFNWLAAASIALGGMIAACSDGAGSSLVGGSRGASSGYQGGGTPAATATSGTSTPAPTTTPAPAGTSSNPPPPTSGPGSAGSAAHQYFTANVYTKLSPTPCGACHNNAVGGAPKFLGATADEAYQNLDIYGLIKSDSMLLSKGGHDNGSAPALTADQQSAVTTWLGMEATERAGTPAAASIFEKLATCFTEADYKPVKAALDQIRTTPRQGENTNRCTGCNNTPCRDCHAQSEYGFLVANENLTPIDTYFAQWVKNTDFVQTYIGTNGTQLVVSPKVTTKAAAVATGKPYSHPMFTSANAEAAITTFANGIIAKYNAKTCGQ